MVRCLLLTLLLLAFAGANTYAADCGRAYANLTPDLFSVKEFTAGKTYFIHPNGSSEILEAAFVREERDEAENRVLVFENKWETNKYKAGEIFAYVKPEDELPLSQQLKIAGRMMANFYAAPFEHVLGKRAVIAQGPGFEMSVGLRATNSAKDAAIELAPKLEAFDRSIKEMGFRLPAHTQILFADQELVPNGLGPFALKSPVFNLVNFRSQQHIRMVPLPYEGTPVNFFREKGVLFHERLHTALIASYRPQAHVNTNLGLQEGLADFFSSEYRHDPQISFGDPDWPPMRDIEARLQTDPVDQKTIAINNPAKIVNDDYRAGLLYANLLWTLRAQLGEEKTKALLKPLLDNLNRMEKSFKAGGFVDAHASTAEKNLRDFEYFLAVLKKTAASGEEKKKIDYVVDTAIRALKLDPASAKRIEAALLSDGQDWSARPVRDLITNNILPYSLVGISGYAIYEMFAPSDYSWP